MNRRNVSPLGAKGARLLAYLVSQINSGRIKKGEAKTFISYSDALRGMGISARGRAGQQLQREGLNELNEWTKENRELPKITGLIVDKKKRLPPVWVLRNHGDGSKAVAGVVARRSREGNRF